MSALLDLLLALLIVLDLTLVISTRITRCVKILAVQGLLLAFLPPVTEGGLEAGYNIWIFAAVVLILKGLLIPGLLLFGMHRTRAEVDDVPFIGTTSCLLLTAAAFVGCRILSARLPWPVLPPSEFFAPVSFLLIFTGLLLIVTRRKALSQVIGYLQLEDGIFVFGMAYPYKHSLLVEAAVLLDVFVAVMVMGLAIFRIHEVFKHIDTDKLSVLRDFRR